MNFDNKFLTFEEYKLLKQSKKKKTLYSESNFECDSILKFCYIENQKKEIDPEFEEYKKNKKRADSITLFNKRANELDLDNSTIYKKGTFI